MKIQKETILFHPLTIFLLLFIAFILAGGPARAGGIEDVELRSGVGGGPGNLSPVPTIMDKQTISNNSPTSDTSDRTQSVMGTVISKSDNSIQLQTLQGRRNISISDNTVVKKDGEIVALKDIAQGDIITMTTDGRGEALSISKENGFLGNVQSLFLIALLGILALGSGVYGYWKNHREHYNYTPLRKRYI